MQTDWQDVRIMWELVRTRGQNDDDSDDEDSDDSSRNCGEEVSPLVCPAFLCGSVNRV